MNLVAEAKERLPRPIRAILRPLYWRLFDLKLFIWLSLKRPEKQERLIHEGNWDNLVILDACRYDYFENEYGNFLNGKLKPIYSPSSNTYSWLRKVFNGWHNVTIYSAHPALNSLGIERGGYRALPHFRKIVDIWDRGWDEKLSTVPSEEVNKAVLEDINRGAFKGKNIIWYIQPHFPWIGKTKLTAFSRDWNDKDLVWQIWEKIRKGEIAKEKLREAYRDNLRLVIQSVSELIPHLDGKTVITSDHGELLGELGMFEHPSNIKAKELREVPWLEVEK